MTMMKSKTTYISRFNRDFAEELVKSGRFQSFSDVLLYAMRFMCDVVRVQGVKSLPELNHAELTKANVRIPENLIDEMRSLRFCKESEIYDLALNFYRKFITQQ